MRLAKSVSFIALALAMQAMPAAAQAPAEAASPAFDISFTYTADGVAVIDGGIDHRLRYLDNIDVIADADLGRLVGWQGAEFHVHVLNNLGRRPNDGAGTLQGINNIEVSKARLKLYEAWIDQAIGDRVKLLVGLHDLNSEFYATDSSGLLIAPPFGIGSEFSSTGPNGPSIFPSTSLAVRLAVKVGNSGYLRVAAFNAHAGTLGDDGGIDVSFHDGLLLVAEAGIEKKGKFAIGGWRYTRRQDDIRERDLSGDPLRHFSQGAYVLAEYPLIAHEGGKHVTAFVRAGISEGRTGMFKGSWQAGFLAEGIMPGRPESQLSFGVAQGDLSGGFRHNQIDSGVSASSGEIGLELTYSDRLTRFLILQPDLQLVHNPGGDRTAANMVAAGIRATVEF